MARTMYAIFSTSSLVSPLSFAMSVPERMGGEKRLLFPRKNSDFQLASEEGRDGLGKGSVENLYSFTCCKIIASFSRWLRC